MKLRLFFIFSLFLSGIFFSIFFINQHFLSFLISSFHLNLNLEFWGLGLQHLGIELTVLSSLFYLYFILENPKKYILFSVSASVLFFVFLFLNSANIPIMDDFSMLDFINHYSTSETWSEKFSLITSFYSGFETRPVVIRLIYILFFKITNEINIKTIVLVCNVSLLLILILLALSFWQNKLKWKIIFLVSIFLLQFAFYDSIVYSTPAIDYQFAVLFFMITLFIIQKKTWHFQLGAFACSLLSAGSLGNGIFVFPIVLLYLFIEKKWTWFSIWFIGFGLFSAFYFRGFAINKLSTGFFPFSFAEYFKYSCCFLGSSFQFFYYLQVPFAIGLLLWILFLTLTLKKYYKTNFLVYGLILFLLLSSAANAVFRLNAGIETAITNRYAFFSVVAVAASLTAIYEITGEKTQRFIIPALFSIGIVYHLASGLFFFPEVPLRKQRLEKFISEIKNSKPVSPFFPIIPSNGEAIVRESIKNKIYFP